MLLGTVQEQRRYGYRLHPSVTGTVTVVWANAEDVCGQRIKKEETCYNANACQPFKFIKNKS